MRFAMLICGVDEDHDTHIAERDPQDGMAAVWAWFERWEKAGKIASGGAELDTVRKARTIRAGADGALVVTDGPYLELKEVVGGFVVLNADDIDEAVAIASEWPISGASSVEVRPVIEH
jgi:hypothetical protein